MTRRGRFLPEFSFANPKHFLLARVVDERDLPAQNGIVKDLNLDKTSEWSQNTTLCMVFGLFLPTKGPIHGSNTPESRFSAHMARYGPKKPPKKAKIPVFGENRLFCL